MKLEPYSFGIGDRFGQQGPAQIRAIEKAWEKGIRVTPVWNKSHREHTTIGTYPEDTRREADRAVAETGWSHAYHVDADHINLNTVDAFLPHSDFFTLDVADSIGTAAPEEEQAAFMRIAAPFVGDLSVPGIGSAFRVTRDQLAAIADRFLGAIREAASIYRRIRSEKGADRFIAEISMDEVEDPQSPVELFFILLMIHHYGIEAQTIAPKFTGRFNKGVDYVGDSGAFRKEFEEDLLVIDFAVRELGLPENLKLSVHSGSDKFTIYPIMGELIRKHGKGIHVKTAGTTWLEEVIGLALAGGEALEMARSIYSSAYMRMDELCGPYATVIDIDAGALPDPDQVSGWDGETFARSLRHVPDHPDYHQGFRQLIHVGYKVAAEMKEDFIPLLQANRLIVSEQVTENLYGRHLRRLFDL